MAGALGPAGGGAAGAGAGAGGGNGEASISVWGLWAADHAACFIHSSAQVDKSIFYLFNSVELQEL
jgi:hypothetical protein